LNTAVQEVVEQLKRITAQALGSGGIVLNPWVHKDQIHVNLVNQSRFFVVEQQGDIITKAAFAADTFQQDQAEYVRMEYHHLAENGLYTIEQQALKNGVSIPLENVPQWSGILPKQTISGVKQMLFAFLKCPSDARRGDLNTVYGTPVTYGAEKLIREITDLLNLLQKEFVNKEAFIGAEQTLFTKDASGREILPNSGLYKLFRATGSVDDKPFFEVFSPDIRVQSFIEGINYKMGLLEKVIGVSHGILTDLETADATATAIRRSSFDTFSLVDSMRHNIEAAMNQLVYAYDVFANLGRLAPFGSYEVTFDWDYSLLEDTQESFDQLERAVAMGAAGPEAIRAYLFDEDPETALANLPKIKPLLGVD
jgi:A118 family predicted phage portal protein